jgi:hypothetical protein
MTRYHERLEAGDFQAPEAPPNERDLEQLTKAELEELAAARGIERPEGGWTKATIREALGE